MKKDELVALGVTEEVADKIINLAAEELKGYIPKARFDEVNDAKKTAEALIKERDGQLEELKKSAGASDDLKAKIAELENKNTESVKAYEARIRDLTIDSALKAKLAGTKYADLLIGKFDREKIVVGADGTVTGIDEQLAGIKTTYKDLFTPSLSGRGEPDNHGSLSGGTGKRAELEKIQNDPSVPLVQRIAAKNALLNLKED